MKSLTRLYALRGELENLEQYRYWNEKLVEQFPNSKFTNNLSWYYAYGVYPAKVDEALKWYEKGFTSASSNVKRIALMSDYTALSRTYNHKRNEISKDPRKSILRLSVSQASAITKIFRTEITHTVRLMKAIATYQNHKTKLLNWQDRKESSLRHFFLYL